MYGELDLWDDNEEKDMDALTELLKKSKYERLHYDHGMWMFLPEWHRSAIISHNRLVGERIDVLLKVNAEKERVIRIPEESFRKLKRDEKTRIIAHNKAVKSSRNSRQRRPPKQG